MRKIGFVLLVLLLPVMAGAQIGLQYFPKKVGILTRSGSAALNVSGGVAADTFRTPHYVLPHADGTNGQVLSTNGSGSVSWIDLSGATLPTLNSAYLWVGNGSNEATAVQISGDGTLSNLGALAVSDDSHSHTGSTLSGIDISDDTNLSASTGISLSGDALSHSTAAGYKHVPESGSSAQILQYSAAGTAKWASVSGDITIADGGAVTLAANAADSTNLADGAVTSETIKDGQVKTADLAANSVDSTKIKDGAVTSESIKDGQVKAADLAALSSSDLAGKLSNETGSGAAVFGTSPTISGATLSAADNTTIPGARQHFRITVVSPNAVFTADSVICLVPKLDAAITVTNVEVTTSSASYQLDADLKYADGFISRTNATVINALDTSSGVLSDNSITSGAVAAGKAVYLRVNAAPNASMTQYSVDISFDYQ